MREVDDAPTKGSQIFDLSDAFDRLEDQARTITGRIERLTKELDPGVTATKETGQHREGREFLGDSVETDSEVAGDFLATSDLDVAGVVTGNLLCKGTLFVAQRGLVRASVAAADVIVAGRLEGQVQCDGRFVVLPTGSVDAIVTTRAALFEPGSRFVGELRVCGDSEQVPIPDDSSFTSRARGLWRRLAGQIFLRLLPCHCVPLGL